jgi:hypothetical protein
MGAEAKCRANVGKNAYDVTALLETDEIILRGGTKLRIPFQAIRSVSAKDGKLRVEHDGAPLSLELGAQAERWAEKIRSPKSRLQKLGVKEGSRVAVVDLSDGAFVDELRAARADLVDPGNRNAEIVFLGVETAAQLSRITRQSRKLAPGAALWVIHPKGKDGVKDTEIFAVAKEAGLTYSKVARFSETHTAERLGWPRSDKA